MSVSPSISLPVTTAPLVRSCSRLIERKSVVLPEPEGPMSAVTLFFGTSKVALRIAVRPWKDTATSSRRMATGPERGSRTSCSAVDHGRHREPMVMPGIHSYRLSLCSQAARQPAAQIKD